MSKLFWTLVALAILCLARPPSSIAGLVDIVGWNFTGESGNQASTAAAFSAPNVFGNPVARGGGIIAHPGTNSLNSRGWNVYQNGLSTGYYTFGFTVDSGYQVTLNELLITTRSSNTGPGTVVLRYSGDGFVSNLCTFIQSPNNSPTNYLDSIVDLSMLTNLTGDLEFRLYSASTISANTGTVNPGGTFRITNYEQQSGGSFRFTGNVEPIPEAIPEPSSLALLGVLGVGMGVWVCRRKKQAAATEARSLRGKS